MKTLLITGAAGGVGRFLRRELAGRYALRLSDRAPITDLQPGETFDQADVARIDHMLRITAGVDADPASGRVVHRRRLEHHPAVEHPRHATTCSRRRGATA